LPNEAYSTQTCNCCKKRTGPKGPEGLRSRITDPTKECVCSDCGTAHHRDFRAEGGEDVDLTGGQVHDVKQAQALLDQIESAAVLADKANDADTLRGYISRKNAKAVIPPRSNRMTPRDFDRHQYRNRNVIKRFFSRLKQFRRIATRYDKLASRFSAFVALAASVIWLKYMSTRPRLCRGGRAYFSSDRRRSAAASAAGARLVHLTNSA
jgi:transposase